jgi:acyl carrier protein
MPQRVADEGHAAHGHQRLGLALARLAEPRTGARGKNDRLSDRRGGHDRHLIRPSRHNFFTIEGGSRSGVPCNIRVTFRGLPSDRVADDTFQILKRISPVPVEPTMDSELLADLGFDSLRVLELVGELEDHFNIAVPLNDLMHIRTVGEIVAEVRALASTAEQRA